MELFKVGFIVVRLVDLLDIAITTFIFYRLYEVLRGTLTLRVLGLIISIFLMWKIVDILDFKLLKFILDQILGLGAVALVILFAPEIRRLLSVISKNTILDRLIRQVYTRPEMNQSSREIVQAIKDLRATGNGALMVFLGQDMLKEVQETGEYLNADISSRLIFSIFQKESPLHDGAMLVRYNKILSVRCILPLSQSQFLAPELGMRHRAALGLSEVSDVLILVVSEERREVSLAQQGRLTRNVDYQEVEKALDSHFQRFQNT